MVTAILGVVVFMIAFLLNIGAKELAYVDAQGGIATTTVTVLNTPPQWTGNAREETASATNTPTNVGDLVTWVATGTDSNSEDYYLLICSASNAPSSTAGGAPTCNGGPTWAVSTATISGTQARVSTTTLDAWSEENVWYAWICDSVNPGARCNATYTGHDNTATSSPFVVNHRPDFTAFYDDSELLNAEPGDTVTFYATATDPDWLGGNDTKKLFVCSTQSFSTSTDDCTATTLASSTFTTATSVEATYSVVIPTRDTTYGAYLYIIDEHGFEAVEGGSSAQATDTVLTVHNSRPSILPGGIVLNNGSDLSLTVEAGETTGFTLTFEASDNNSCSSTSGYPEITDYEIVVYRSGVGTSTCDTTGNNYDPNNCYDSAVPTTTWNLSCTASSGSCTYDVDQIDTSIQYDCTFPLWYVADPTSGDSSESFYDTEDWRASVRPIDDDGATTTLLVELGIPRELNAWMQFAVDTTAIPYGPLEPGQFNDPLQATTTMRATGNVGLDQLLSGEHMCDYYTTAVKCVPSATSTIAAPFQTFATSSYSFAYASNTLGNVLSSSTQANLEVNVFKSTATSSQASGTTYWGIMVPSTITKAGAYTGENTIWGVAGEPAQWQ